MVSSILLLSLEPSVSFKEYPDKKVEKKSLTFLTRFYSHLWLLQGYVYPFLKIIASGAENKTGKHFGRCFGGDKFIGEYFESKFYYVFDITIMQLNWRSFCSDHCPFLVVNEKEITNFDIALNQYQLQNLLRQYSESLNWICI